MIVAGVSGECHEKVIDRRDGDVLVAAYGAVRMKTHNS